jgi:hypothetical protein
VGTGVRFPLGACGFRTSGATWRGSWTGWRLVVRHGSSRAPPALASRLPAPVGGTSEVPTFVALLGSDLNVTVVVDADAKMNQRLTDPVAKGLLTSQRLVTMGEVIDKAKADIEDLLAVDEYLALYNNAFGTKRRAW